jgi:hypothetical protein
MNEVNERTQDMLSKARKEKSTMSLGSALTVPFRVSCDCKSVYY